MIENLEDELRNVKIDGTLENELRNIKLDIFSLSNNPNNTLKEFLRKPTKTIGGEVSIIEPGTYNVTRDLIVKEKISLRDVQLVFSPGAGMIVYGGINLEGTKEKPIILTGDGWKNLVLYEGESTIKHTIMNGGSARIEIPDAEESFFNMNDSLGGNLYIENVNAVIDHLTLMNSKAGGGMYAYSSWIDAKNVLAYENLGNVKAGGITIKSGVNNNGKNSILRDSMITKNESTGTGGLEISSSSIQLENMQITNNKSQISYGGVLLEKNSYKLMIEKEITIKNITIEENQGLIVGGLALRGVKIPYEDLMTCKIQNNKSHGGKDHDVSQEY